MIHMGEKTKKDLLLLKIGKNKKRVLILFTEKRSFPVRVLLLYYKLQKKTGCKKLVI